MQIERRQFGLNRRQQRKQSSLLTLLAPVQLSLFIVIACGAVRAQCYVEPLTGRQVCTAPGAGTPRLAGSQPSIDQRPHCRISVADGSTGSGTLIGVDKNFGLVLTCSHVFNGSTQQIIVTFPDGGRFAARLIERDRAHDLAALAIQRPNLGPIAVSEEDPGGTLAACGFGPDGQFRCVRGGVTGHATAVGAVYPALTISGAVRPGDSGGGVLNTRGQLVGVVWGQQGGLTYATCGRPLRAFLDRVRGRWAGEHSPARGPHVDWQAWSREIETRIRALDEKKQDRGEYLRPGDLNGYLRISDAAKLDTSKFAQRSELDSGLKTLSARFESVHSRVESVRQRLEQVAASKGGFFQGLSLGKLVAGALGLSGPLAAAVILAGGLAGRRLKHAPLRVAAKRLAARRSDSEAERAYEPIAVDSPPPPQRTVPETHYVPIEKDSFAKAHQWASEHVARKYPGASEILQAQDSLIKQYLSAH